MFHLLVFDFIIIGQQKQKKEKGEVYFLPLPFLTL